MTVHHFGLIEDLDSDDVEPTSLVTGVVPVSLSEGEDLPSSGDDMRVDRDERRMVPVSEDTPPPPSPLPQMPGMTLDQSTRFDFGQYRGQTYKTIT